MNYLIEQLDVIMEKRNPDKIKIVNNNNAREAMHKAWKVANRARSGLVKEFGNPKNEISKGSLDGLYFRKHVFFDTTKKLMDKAVGARVPWNVNKRFGGWQGFYKVGDDYVIAGINVDKKKTGGVEVILNIRVPSEGEKKLFWKEFKKV